MHVLSTPPAFILSQDQTLMFKVLSRQNLLAFYSDWNLNLLFLRSLISQSVRSGLSTGEFFSRTPSLWDFVLLNLSRFYSLFSYQGSCCRFRDSSFTISQLFAFVNNFFYFLLRKFLSFAINSIIISHIFYFVNSFFHFFTKNASHSLLYIQQQITCCHAA